MSDKMFYFDNVLFDKLLLDAERSIRKRAHYNIHKEHSEPVQRLCIALKSGTYVRPHSHIEAEGWEMIMALRGRVVMLIFDIDGCVKERIELSPDTEVIGVEMRPDTWHTVFPVDSEAIIFEVKEGPYRPKKGGDFADWSPEENSPDAATFLTWAKTAAVGDRY